MPGNLTEIAPQLQPIAGQAARKPRELAKCELTVARQQEHRVRRTGLQRHGGARPARSPYRHPAWNSSATEPSREAFDEKRFRSIRSRKNSALLLDVPWG